MKISCSENIRQTIVCLTFVHLVDTAERDFAHDLSYPCDEQGCLQPGTRVFHT